MADKEHEVLTVQEVADILRVHAQTIRKHIKEGSFNILHIGGRGYRITREELDRFISEGGARPQGRPRKSNAEDTEGGETKNE